MRPPQRPAIYLAGPTVFDPDPDAIFRQMKQVCAVQGLEAISPLDNQIGLQGLAPGRTLARRIVQADIALMRRVNAGIFCLDGFRRGPEMDPGTAFEVGYMHALGKPLVGWTRDLRDYPARVRDFFADTFGLALVTGDTSPTAAQPGAGRDDPPGSPARVANDGPVGARSGLQRDPDGVLVHSHGCLQNAMVHVGIELSGGTVCADTAWLTAFAAAVRHLMPLLGMPRPD